MGKGSERNPESRRLPLIRIELATLTVEDGQSFIPFTQTDFQNFCFDELVRPLVFSDGSKGTIALFRDTDLIIESTIKDGFSSVLTPVGKVATFYEAMPGCPRRVWHPICLSIGVDDVGQSRQLCIVEFPSKEVRLSSRVRKSELPEGVFLQFEDDEHKAKDYFVYLPENPEILSDMKVTFTSDQRGQFSKKI